MLKVLEPETEDNAEATEETVPPTLDEIAREGARAPTQGTRTVRRTRTGRNEESGGAGGGETRADFTAATGCGE